MIVGITGKTGSGKSTAAGIFRAHGIPVVDADEIARAVSAEPEMVSRLVGAFGKGIARGAEIDRAALAAIVFSDEQKRQTLNGMVHPRIIERIDDAIKDEMAMGAAIVAVDAALLFESGYDARCDLTILVRARKEERVSRVVKRDGLDRAAALMRIDAQGDEGPKADIVLDNDGGAEAFKSRVTEVVRQLKGGRS